MGPLWLAPLRLLLLLLMLLVRATTALLFMISVLHRMMMPRAAAQWSSSVTGLSLFAAALKTPGGAPGCVSEDHHQFWPRQQLPLEFRLMSVCWDSRSTIAPGLLSLQIDTT
jgi:hypothetical protein